MLALEFGVQGGSVGFHTAAMALLLAGVLVKPGLELGVAEPFGQRPAQIRAAIRLTVSRTVDGAAPVRRAISRFERFISASRNEPPDIDIDFQHERREEVMQYIYGKYGRHRAVLVATLITHREKMAIREVGKVLGLSEDVVGALSGALSWQDEVRPAMCVPRGSIPAMCLGKPISSEASVIARHSVPSEPAYFVAAAITAAWLRADRSNSQKH